MKATSPAAGSEHQHLEHQVRGARHHPCHRGRTSEDTRLGTAGHRRDGEGRARLMEKGELFDVPCHLKTLSNPCALPSCWCRSVSRGHFTKTVCSLKRNGRSSARSPLFIHPPTRTPRRMAPGALHVSCGSASRAASLRTSLIPPLISSYR